MTAPRSTLLFALLAAAPTLPGLAEAAPPSYADVGSWGQAWEEDEGRPAAPVSAPARPAGPARATAQPASPSYTDVGSWGQAWEEDGSAPTVPMPATVPLQPAAAPSPPPSSPRPQPVPTAAPAAAEPANPPSPPVAAAKPSADAPTQPATAEEPAGGRQLVMPRRPPRLEPEAQVRARRRAEDPDAPFHLEADQITYDREYEIVTARGKVVMIHNSRTITADTLSYNLKQDLMGASGNVEMTDVSGEVTRAEYVELTGDMKAGVAREIRVLLADDSRMSAETAERVGGDHTNFSNAAYTACEPCRKYPDRTPLWQANARHVTHNQAEAQIEYRDVWLEVAGVPILYTPYLSHPDPTVRRKSGFLTPLITSSSTLGASAAVPYFVVISDQEDLTLSPRFFFEKASGATTTTDSTVSTGDPTSSSVFRYLQMSGQHRLRTFNGETRTDGSITADQTTGEARGHLDSKGLFELDETWRFGWQAQYQSDEAYRTLYRVKMSLDRPWLVTRPYLEGFGRRSYAMAEMMTFQGHTVVDDGTTAPLVLPHLVYNRISEPGWGGSYWTSDTDILMYTRNEGTDARRLSHRTGWTLPVTTSNGQRYTLSAGLRGDGYDATGINGNTGESYGSTARAIPDMSVQWSYPFSRPGARLSQIIEPLGMLAFSPIGGNSSKIPNEDSIDFELDETNVLRPNRLVGLDRVEGGLRGGYGVRWSAYQPATGKITAQIAQGWRHHVDSTTFGAGSGFTDNFSDYLGRVDITPIANLTLSDRLRIDKDSFGINRNEARVTVGPPSLNAWASYIMLSSKSNEGTTTYGRRQYVSYGASSYISQYWYGSVSLNNDLEKNGGLLGVTLNTGYSDECFALIGSFNRYYTTQTGVLSGYGASLTFVLKTLGSAKGGL